MKSGELIIRLLLLSLLLTSIILVATGIKADSSVSAQPIGQAIVYTAPYTSTSFVLNTTVNPINPIASNIRLFKYPNLTGPIQTFVSQGWSSISSGSYPSSRVIKVVPGSGVSGVYPDYLFNGSLFRVGSVVESTAWGSAPKPYYQGNLLVFNTTTSGSGQYIAWYFVPPTTTLNVTIHVVSFPQHNNYYVGIGIYSPNIGNQSDDDVSGTYVMQIDFFGPTIWYHGPSANWQNLDSSLPQPNPNYPFTFTIIFTENSAGNVTVSEIGINGTYTTINVNTPFPWSEMGYVGIRGDSGNLFYVSYFAASSGPVFAQFVPTPSISSEGPLVATYTAKVVESTAWGTSPKPYYQGNLLVVNSTGSSQGQQYIGWNFTPSTTTL
ncbi:MAG: hypothetical protein QW430_12100, partial [Metallosphaera sp.]|uniref:hypothetical protein n=1 Tax=Metallosphaera sp. TaxID=2020860 RepID=UPI003166250F